MKSIHRSEPVKSCETCRWRSIYDISYHKTCKENRVEAGLPASICINKSAWEPEQKERTAETVKDCTTCHWQSDDAKFPNKYCADRRREAGYCGESGCKRNGYYLWKAKECKPEEVTETKKPALGIKPEYLWLEDRIKELARAIANSDEFNYDWAKEMAFALKRISILKAIRERK